MVTISPAQLTPETLASVLEQSADCVKLVGLAGQVMWMNHGGLCAMEIGELDRVMGVAWADFWPAPARGRIAEAYERAAGGVTDRFEAACPTFLGSPRWWENSVSAVRDGEGRLSGYLCISRDVTERWRDREALAVLMSEMRHRLRNTYAIMGGLMRGIAQGDPARERFADEMADRLMALAAAQSLFESDAAPAALSPLLQALILPFHGPNCPIRVEAGADVRLSRASADAIALVVGELSVNSGKYGALAHGGLIDVTAAVTDGRLELVWSEQAKRPVTGQSREGGEGLSLIGMIVEARQGVFDIAWHQDGLTATLGLSLG